MRIYNYTGNDLKLFISFRTFHLKSSGRAIVEEEQITEAVSPENFNTITGKPIPVTINTYTGIVTGLPPATPGIAYVVHAAIASALPYRDDLLLPDDPVYSGAVISGYKALKWAGYRNPICIY